MPPPSKPFVLVAYEEDYKRDKSFSDSFLPSIYALLAPIVMRVATAYEDMTQATDIVSSPLTIASRVRRFKWQTRYGSEVTWRAWRASGVETETDKVFGDQSRWPDLSFYGFGDDEKRVPNWVLLDMHKVRAAVKIEPKLLRPIVKNDDGVTGFQPMETCELPLGCVVAHQDFVMWGPCSNETPEDRDRRAFSKLSIETRLADVCPRCGNHMISSASERLAWLGRPDTSVACPRCYGVTKRSPRASPLRQQP